MRSYILTDRERALIKAFLETKDIPKKDYISWCQLRWQYRKNEATIRQDLELLVNFMETVRKPKCFGTVKVNIDVHPDCLKCAAQGRCMTAYVEAQR